MKSANMFVATNRIGRLFLLPLLWLLHGPTGANAGIFGGGEIKDLNLYPDYENFPFFNGVASGDPLFDSILIWTRVTQGEWTGTELDTSVPRITSIQWALWDQLRTYFVVI